MNEDATRTPPAVAEAPGAVSTRHDWTATPPSRAVVETVAAATNTPTTDLPTLYSCIDPDALDDILRQSPGREGDGPVRISLAYGGADVRVASTGELVVTPR